eukprot:TRINITY_DN61514_c0_g1_i1.p1 TRINITY_DN61514_c0_g1~~TRINITY_DN61514_c0_g1_i1.p1  ORF type:complete len:906 (+),score=125.73 TRINITY_DN61514_c0_g1_i1:348-2720(+)
MAAAVCDQDESCVGFMRYVGDNPVHCRDWCGRPQFCVSPPPIVEIDAQDGGETLDLNNVWVSYVKTAYADSLGLPRPSVYAFGTTGVAISRWQTRSDPTGDSVAPLRPRESFWGANCDGFRAAPWSGPPVVVLAGVPAAPHAKSSKTPPTHPLPGACRVLYQPFGAPAVTEEEARAAGIHGILSEAEAKDLPLFTAARGFDTARADFGGDAASGKDADSAATIRGLPWRYFFDGVPVFPAKSLGSSSEKPFDISFYFLSIYSTCPGPHNETLWPDDVANRLSTGSEHVYVEDGSHATREAAFKNYRFTIICGDFTQEAFPPRALVYAVAHATHLLVPEWMHWRASRLFFHLPDAAQGYKMFDVSKMEAYLADIYSNPKRAEILEFKQTFTLLIQQLFWYRYREPARRRAEVAACALCDAVDRERRRSDAAGTAVATTSVFGAAAAAVVTASSAPQAAAAVHSSIDASASVAVLFCVMSRRSAFELRRVMRETWGQAIAQSAPGTAQRFFVGRVTDMPLEDVGVGDVVELPVPESYRTLNIKAFAMLSWAESNFPNLQWLVRHDDDVYLRASALLAHLDARPPVRYLWGNFDHGSSPVRDPTHPHYNTYEQFHKQEHPFWGDIFPPYARGLLWAMSADLLSAVVAQWRSDVDSQPNAVLDEAVANQMPHPDDPAIGTFLSGLVVGGMSLNFDDRDFNSFSLNPSCNSSFSNINNHTWVVHHVEPETMRCMWALDMAEDAAHIGIGNSAFDASKRSFPDLCLCSTEVIEEEEPEDQHGQPFWYPRHRFNTAR